MIKLISQRIYLKELERQDCHKLYKATDFDPNTEYQKPLPYSKAAADSWYEEIVEMQHKKHVRLGIYINDDEVIGDVAIQDIDHEHKHATLGLSINALKHRNLGYGKEALERIIKYGFETLKLHRLEAETSSLNKPAQKVLEDLGFHHEGTKRETIFYRNHYHDTLIYGLLGDAYAQKSKSQSRLTF